jgi:hypothetical protein
MFHKQLTQQKKEAIVTELQTISRSIEKKIVALRTKD